MSAGEAYISYISGSYLLILLLIITAIPSLGLCHTTAACLPEELSPGPSLNGARQGQALCSISLLIPVHLSSSSATCPLLPLSPPTLSLLNFTLGLTSICWTTNALTRIHFESCRVVGWMEIDDSISRMKLRVLLELLSPSVLPAPALVPVLPFPFPPTTCYHCPGLLRTANFSSCMGMCVRWLLQNAA